MTLGVATRPARQHDPFVGRADELDSLEQILDELERGRPGAIELVGERGIGNTRLPRELATRRSRLERSSPTHDRAPARGQAGPRRRMDRPEMAGKGAYS